MAKAIVVRAALGSKDFPAGTEQGLFRFTLTGPGFSKEVEDAGAEVTITVPGGGQYTGMVEALDAAGKTLASVSATIDVPVPQPVTLLVPVSLSLATVEV